MKRKKRIALEFAVPSDDYVKAMELLDQVEGRWSLPGEPAIIIEYDDLHLFEDAGLKFKKVPVVSAADVPREELAILRRRAHGL